MSEINNNEDLNEGFELEFDDSDVITVPIDTTLTQENAAADAKAVGDALARKADADSVNNIDVNNQEADNQGHIILTAEHVPMSESDSTTVKAKIQAVDGKTGATILLTAESGAPTIADAFNGIGAQNATTIPMSAAQGAQTIAQKIAEMETAAEGTVKSVNSVAADANGDVSLNEVPFAQNLTSDQAQAVVGAFILRTTGGSRSVGSGTAQVQEIRGAMNHTGVVPESIDTTVSAAQSGITADVTDRDAWVTEVEESGSYTFDSDGSNWTIDGDSVDLADYGITVDGDPDNGDSITVVYVKGDRGLITPATPTALRATGWNLFNPSVGYARVAGYDGAYHVGGSYTGLQFSATLNGARSALTVNNGSFTVPGDGFVWVTGGNATDTYITTEWTDWTAGPSVDWAAYSETVINLSAIMTANFPNGLLAVGAIYDSISIDQGRAISRVERLDYDVDTLAEIIEEGRAHVVDENYIYVVRTSPISVTISISGQFTANDHGIEIFDGTEVAPEAVILYGQNLKAKLINEVLIKGPMNMSETDEVQVMKNIGVWDLLKELIITREFNKSYSLSAGAGAALSSTDLGYSIPEGYKPLGVAYANTGKNTVCISGIYLSETGISLRVVNTASVAQSGTIGVSVIFIKDIQ